MLCIIAGILINNFTNLSPKLNSGIQFSKKNLLQIGYLVSFSDIIEAYVEWFKRLPADRSFL